MLLEQILGTRNQIRVLRALFRCSGVTVSEAARDAGLRPSAALFALQRLVETGLVRAERRGRRRVYTVNRTHFLSGPIEQLLAAEAGVGAHLVSVARTLLGEEGAEALEGLCLSPDGRVYVCHRRPEVVDGHRLDRVLESMFGLRLASVVPNPRRVHEPHLFVPAGEPGPAVSPSWGGADSGSDQHAP